MRRKLAADWKPYPNGILPAARPRSGHDLGCRVALPKGCDGFGSPCWTDDDCRWDASFRSPGPRRCRLARSPRRRKSCRQPPRHPMGFLRLLRRSHDKKPTRESCLLLGGMVPIVQQVPVELPEVLPEGLKDVAMGRDAWSQLLLVAIFMDPAQS